MNASLSGSRGAKRMGPAAAIGGLLLAAAVAAPALIAPSPTHAASAPPCDAFVAAPAPLGVAPATAPVREIVDSEIGWEGGVKGTFYNRSTTPITINAHKSGEHSNPLVDSFTLQPAEHFTFLMTNKIIFKTSVGDASVYYSSKQPGYWNSTIADCEIDHKEVPSQNRKDGDGWKGLDVSVKREHNGKLGIKGEDQKSTRNWSNYNLFVDDYNAAVTSIDGNVSNETDTPVAVRAFKDGKPSSGLVHLQPRERHQFSFAGTGNTVKVFNPTVSKSQPVGVLTYDCPNRLSWGKVTSTYIDTSTWTKKTLTSDNNLGVHGGSAHLDGPGTGTYVDRPGENKDPNVRTNSKSSVTIKLYKIGHTKL